jgi:hypothetical protein
MVACEKPREGPKPIVERPIIGRLDLKARFLDVYVRLPASHVGRLATIASGERIKFVSLFASRCVSSRALIRSLNFSTHKPAE